MDRLGVTHLVSSRRSQVSISSSINWIFTVRTINRGFLLRLTACSPTPTRHSKIEGGKQRDGPEEIGAGIGRYWQPGPVLRDKRAIRLKCSIEMWSILCDVPARPEGGRAQTKFQWSGRGWRRCSLSAAWTGGDGEGGKGWDPVVKPSVPAVDTTLAVVVGWLLC